jgi:WD40 repeat protein
MRTISTKASIQRSQLISTLNLNPSYSQPLLFATCVSQWHFLCEIQQMMSVTSFSLLNSLSLCGFLQEYQLSARFKGSTGPINCLAFSQDGIFLASGGT